MRDAWWMQTRAVERVGETVAATWSEICASYPDQWVGLIDVIKNSEMPHDVRVARVVASSASPAEVLQALRPYRAQHPEARHLFTGTLRAPRRS